MSGIKINLPQPSKAEATEGTDGLKEAAAIAADIDLSDRAKLNAFNSLNRNDAAESHIHKVTVCAIYVVGGACLLMFLVLVSEYILPERYRPLTEAESTKLQSFLFSGAVGSLLAKAVSRIPGAAKQS